jgi:hypothetical protein
MPSAPQTTSSQNERRPILLFTLVTISLLVSLATVRIMTRSSANNSIFTMSNLIGPTTQSLLAGGGLSVCTEDMGTPGNPVCFHAGRMPMASLVMALGIRLLAARGANADS